MKHLIVISTIFYALIGMISPCLCRNFISEPQLYSMFNPLPQNERGLRPKVDLSKPDPMPLVWACANYRTNNDIGINTWDLENEACALANAFPLDFVDDFVVLDQSLYALSFFTDSEKFVDLEWERIKAFQLNGIAAPDYYFLMATFTNPLTGKSEFRISIKLPNTDDFAIITPAENRFIESWVKATLDFNLNNQYFGMKSVAESKVAGMEELKKIVLSIIDHTYVAGVSIEKLVALGFSEIPNSGSSGNLTNSTEQVLGNEIRDYGGIKSNGQLLSTGAQVQMNSTTQSYGVSTRMIFTDNVNFTSTDFTTAQTDFDSPAFKIKLWMHVFEDAQGIETSFVKSANSMTEDEADALITTLRAERTPDVDCPDNTPPPPPVLKPDSGGAESIIVTNNDCIDTNFWDGWNAKTGLLYCIGATGQGAENHLLYHSLPVFPANLFPEPLATAARDYGWGVICGFVDEINQQVSMVGEVAKGLYKVGEHSISTPLWYYSLIKHCYNAESIAAGISNKIKEDRAFFGGVFDACKLFVGKIVAEMTMFVSEIVKFFSPYSFRALLAKAKDTGFEVGILLADAVLSTIVPGYTGFAKMTSSGLKTLGDKFKSGIGSLLKGTKMPGDIGLKCLHGYCFVPETLVHTASGKATIQSIGERVSLKSQQALVSRISRN